MSAAPVPRPDVRDALLARLAGFAGLLRERGLPVGPSELVLAAEALDVLGVAGEEARYWALRVALVKRVEQIAAFDRAFAEYWRAGAPLPISHSEGNEEPGEESSEAGDGDPGGDADSSEQPGAGARRNSPSLDRGDGAEELAPRAVYSDAEILRRDFADYTAADEAALPLLLAGFGERGPWRRSRRRRAGGRGRLDVRRTVRAGLRTGGLPVRRVHQRQLVKHRPLTFVCDVSGSMESYSRALLHLAHAALIARRQVEAFAFATRVTHITRELLAGDPALATAGAARAVADWSGGTRVGASLRTLNRTHRTQLQGAVVIVASDGWDLGPPEELAAEAALLARIAHRVIWVNPHLRDPAFEPLTRGMAAALPHVDHFLPCHDFHSFAELMDLLDEL